MRSRLSETVSALDGIALAVEHGEAEGQHAEDGEQNPLHGESEWMRVSAAPPARP